MVSISIRTNKAKKSNFFTKFWLVGLLCLPLLAQAQTRAWLDRDQIDLSESVTLNIETDQLATAGPDYQPLLADFSVSGHSSSRRFENINGRTRTTTLFAVALRPKRDGTIMVPALNVGAAATQALPLTVTASAVATAPAGSNAGDLVFIQTEVDAQAPYVQQAVGVVVRLFYATPLLSGQLDQATPNGASMQRVGEDLQYVRDVGSRRYTVVERRFLMIPERSGALTIPGATFQGRGAGGFLDEIFSDGQRELRASATSNFLRVRPIPANAPQPWLPLHALSLRYVATPQSARAGEAATISVEANVDGASAAQMPALEFGAVEGAQIFAEPTQANDAFNAGRPQVKITRKFSVVPTKAGGLRIPGPRMRWWDVQAGIVRTASLPDLNLQVSPGANGFGASSVQNDADTINATQSSKEWMRVPGVQGEVHPWALATVIFAALWLVTLSWGLHRRAASTTPLGPHDEDAVADIAHPSPTLRDLKRMLDVGDLGEIAALLCAMARPPVIEVDALRERLADSAQVDAIDQLQRARWGGGSAVTARQHLQDAFKNGPRWQTRQQASASLLRPLYPD